jgi:type IV secretion system protein VirB10
MVSSPEDPTAARLPEPGAIVDRRVTPKGGLPRHIQMWLMVGIAGVMLAIIFLTSGRSSTSRPGSSARPTPPTLVPIDRVRSYEEELAADVARQQPLTAAPPARTAASQSTGAANSTSGSLAEEQRRREYQSLFSDSVALSRRTPDRQSYAVARDAARGTPVAPASSDADLVHRLLQTIPNPSSPPPTLAPSAGPRSMEAVPASTGPPAQAASNSVTPVQTDPVSADGATQRLLEGTVIEAVLLTRLDGTFAGPVVGLVTTPVYAHDRQSVLIPSGARVLGSASPVQSWGDARLAVGFHRLLLPDGRTYSLDRFKGLDQIGDTGLKDTVNHHYLQVFGASLAIGALSGLAQYNTRSGPTVSIGDEDRQAMGASLATSATRVLDRYLNVLPTVTIREGHRIKVYLTNDLELPVYADLGRGVR